MDQPPMRHARPQHRPVPPGRASAPQATGRPGPPRSGFPQVDRAAPRANSAPPRSQGTFGGDLDLPAADPPTEVLRPVEAPTQVIRPVRRRPPVDPPTEVITPEPPIGDDHSGDEPPGDHEDIGHDEPEPRPRPKASVASVVVRSVGELMVTAGLVILLFVVYEVWITDLMSAQKQAEVTADLDRQWEAEPAPDPERTQKFEYADGEGIAKLYIPVFGPDYHFTIVEGTSAANLEVGPGHYKKSAAPGQPGNFSVAGHRVGKGAPFNDLGLLNPCDAVVIETQTDWYVYRMLPTAEQPVAAGDPRCAGVEAQTGEYAAAVGRRIVTPDKGEVVLPVPGNKGARVPDDQLKSMLTLTTCHPKFSNAQRMIIHGVLVRSQPKSADPAAVPAELSES